MSSADVWALWPRALTELSRYAAAPLPAQTPTSQARLNVFEGVAFIELDGPLHRGTGWLAALYGGANIDSAHGLFDAAMRDDRVKSILLSVDSPGGTVPGVQEFSRTIFAARGKKPVAAWTDGVMASAAYWLSSAADEIYISGDTTMVGSIGVVTKHVDVSKAEERLGVKTTEIYAGKYKTLGSPHAPLRDDARQSLQAIVDGTYKVFVDAVAEHRGVPVQRVLDQMAEGRIFLGREAIKAGLVDGVATLDQVFDLLRTR